MNKSLLLINALLENLLQFEKQLEKQETYHIKNTRIQVGLLKDAVLNGNYFETGIAYQKLVVAAKEWFYNTQSDDDIFNFHQLFKKSGLAGTMSSKHEGASFDYLFRPLYYAIYQDLLATNPTILDSVSVEVLDIYRGNLDSLIHEHLFTIGSIRTKSKSELCKLNGFKEKDGKYSISVLEEALKQFGITLND